MKSSKHLILSILLALACNNEVFAFKIIYTKADSIKAEQIMQQASRQPKGTNLIKYIGQQFVGTPYVAQTLEVGKTENLVINTSQLDCTTFVENVLALYLCVKEGKTHFADFCHQIQTIRYENGNVNYPSRLHYFSTWISSNTTKGIVKEVSSPNPPFSAQQQINVYYMSTHADKYPLLNGNAEYISKIKKAEQSINGTTCKYIPKKLLNKSKVLKKAVADGDIIAIVTNKKGLDISHVGYASWHKDGLHLMNASSIHHKVVDEPMTIYEYMQKHPSQTGIRIIRVKK